MEEGIWKYTASGINKTSHKNVNIENAYEIVAIYFWDTFYTLHRLIQLYTNARLKNNKIFIMHKTLYISHRIGLRWSKKYFVTGRVSKIFNEVYFIFRGRYDSTTTNFFRFYINFQGVPT